MNYVIDTSTILYNWNSLRSFPNESIIIPYQVLNDLDKFKTDFGEVGDNARAACNFICKYVNSSEKFTFKKIFKLDNGSRLFLWEPVEGVDSDGKILATVKKVQERFQDEKTILVTKKTSFRLLAHGQQIQSIDFNDVGEFQDKSGWQYVEFSADDFAKVNPTIGSMLYDEKFNDYIKNSYIVPTCDGKAFESVVYRVCGNGYLKVIDRKPHSCGIVPKNLEQMMSFDLLMNDDIPLTALVAKAGTGKTLLAIASGLQKVLVEKKYRKLVITRPVVPIGRDIGFLPGDMEDKMEQWLLPFWNNIEYISSINNDAGKRKFSKEKLNMLLDKEARKELIQILPITYMRGSSISNAYIIIDEAQNTTPSEMKTIITRIGEGSKLVLTGDIEQIDDRFLSKECNGLTMAVQKFYGKDLFGFVKLEKSERSPLSELANDILF